MNSFNIHMVNNTLSCSNQERLTYSSCSNQTVITCSKVETSVRSKPSASIFETQIEHSNLKIKKGISNLNIYIKTKPEISTSTLFLSRN